MAVPFQNCREQFFCTGSASLSLEVQTGGHHFQIPCQEEREGCGGLCRVSPAAHLFLLQQGKGVCQQRHPEGAGSDASRHQHQKQAGSFREPLLPVQPVELSVLPCTQVLVKGKRRQCLSDLGDRMAGGPFAPVKPVLELTPTERRLQRS